MSSRQSLWLAVLLAAAGALLVSTGATDRDPTQGGCRAKLRAERVRLELRLDSVPWGPRVI